MGKKKPRARLNCIECPEYSTCRVLCPRAEMWVNQDHVSQRELPLSCINNTSIYNDSNFDNIEFHVKHNRVSSGFEMAYNIENINLPCLTRDQNKILSYYYIDGLSYSQIAQRMRIGKSRIKNQKYLAKRKIKELFSLGRKHEIFFLRDAINNPDKK